MGVKKDAGLCRRVTEHLQSQISVVEIRIGVSRRGATQRNKRGAAQRNKRGAAQRNISGPRSETREPQRVLRRL